MALEVGRHVADQLDEQVADAFRLQDQSLDDLPIGVLVFLDGEVVRINDGWTSLTGLGLSDSKGSRWLTAVHPDDRAHAETVPRLAFGGTDAAGDWRLVRPDGTEVWVHARVRHAKTVNVRTCVVTLTEIAMHKANELRLIHLATHDPLTGLRNRESFAQRVDGSLARGAIDHVTAVLFIDLDRFKVVNDRHGHQRGDKLLAAVARRLRATVRPFDTLGRLGGDEFGIVCEVAAPDDATRLAERVVDAISEPFLIDEDVLTIGASVGIATAPPRATTSDELIAEADHAMYRAKEAGGSQWWMNGSREIDLRVRHAQVEANTAVGEIGVELGRLVRRVEELQHSTTHLHDERLSDRLKKMRAALDVARSQAEERAPR